MELFHSLWPARIILIWLISLEIMGGLQIIPLQTEFTWKGLLLQSVVALIGLEILERVVQKNKLDLSVGILGLFLTGQIVIDAFGDMFHWYGRFSGYDQLLHFTGGFVFALITTGFVRAYFKKKRTRLLKREVAFFGLSVAALGTILYEAEEYLEDVLTGSQRLGNGFDTADDLLLGVIGAALAAAMVVALPKLTQRP